MPFELVREQVCSCLFNKLAEGVQEGYHPVGPDLSVVWFTLLRDDDPFGRLPRLGVRGCTTRPDW